MNKSTREVGKQLEYWFAEELTKFGIPARPTKNSGASGELEDINCYKFICQMKVDNKKENVIIKHKDWIKLLNKIPVDSLRIPLFINQNSVNEKFVTLRAEDFLRLIGEKNV